MSHRPVIPPASTAGMSDSETMDVLRKRMDTAEEDTKKLVHQLTNMGFPPAAAAVMFCVRCCVLK